MGRQHQASRAQPRCLHFVESAQRAATEALCGVSPLLRTASVLTPHAELWLALLRVSDKDAAHALVAGELQLTQKALTDRNPKSYSTWHHRRWIVQLVLQGSAPGMEAAEAAAAAEGSTPWQQHLQGAVTAEAELKLCTHFLTLDERNFHCWNYRRFIVQLGSLPLEDELAFTAQLIERNFSNYSAWHYRADLLQRLDQVSIESLRAGERTPAARPLHHPLVHSHFPTRHRRVRHPQGCHVHRARRSKRVVLSQVGC